MTGLARVRYGTPEFEILTSGDHVACAVTGTRIPLETLNYWSVELQEAYVSAAQMTERWMQTRRP